MADNPTPALHRFEVHPWQGIEPTKLVARQGYNREEGFFLALALIFNDLKGLLLYESQLHPHQPASP